jgi:hypothetical protein
MPVTFNVNMEEMARDDAAAREESVATNIRRNLRKAVTESGAEIPGGDQGSGVLVEGLAVKGRLVAHEHPSGYKALAMSFGAQKVTVQAENECEESTACTGRLEFGTANRLPGIPKFVKKGQTCREGQVGQSAHSMSSSVAEGCDPWRSNAIPDSYRRDRDR